MDFAKNILSKYGWKEGQGIGKHSDGILKPIKVNLKFDKDGLGHDKAKDFTNHWWENAYNDAANNIEIDRNSSADNESVAISLKNGVSIDVTTNGLSLHKLRNKGDTSGYGATFRKMSSTLNNQIDGSDDDDEFAESMASKKSNKLTDEELLKACGGRTAHKGARHGLSLNGKLNRIEEQERQLLAKYTNNFDISAAQEGFKDWIQVGASKKKAVKAPTVTDHTATSPDTEKLAALLDESDYVVKYKSRKKKRRHKAIDEDLATTLSKCLTTKASIDDKLHGINAVSSVIKKKKSQKDGVEKVKKKKNRKRKTDLGMLLDEDVEFNEVEDLPPALWKASVKVADVDEVDTVKINSSKRKKKKKVTEVATAPNEESGDEIAKFSKREEAQLKKNDRKIAKLTKKLESVITLNEESKIIKKKKKKKKSK